MQWLSDKLFPEALYEQGYTDILAEAMLRLEDNGYAMILSVHDENVCETPEDFGGIEEYEALMQKLPQWAEGCPVSAESYRAVRYRK